MPPSPPRSSLESLHSSFMWFIPVGLRVMSRGFLPCFPVHLPLPSLENRFQSWIPFFQLLCGPLSSFSLTFGISL